ncbi:MAG TPA: HAMP domain-containing sensor histidine kinase [Candidatus Dormibacteraeota bacterium]
MSPASQQPLSLIRERVLASLEKPTPELIDRSLSCLLAALDVQSAFLARIDDDVLEVVASVGTTAEPAVEPGLRLSLDESFHGDNDDGAEALVNVRDASKQLPYKNLPMRQRFGIVSYLGTVLQADDKRAVLAVTGTRARVFTEADQDLLLVVAGLLSPRLGWGSAPGNGQRRTPVWAMRLASHDVKEPLAILRGYADMLSNHEVPAEQMAMVADRLASQSETLMRVADQVLLLARLPMELAFTVRVSLGAIAQASAARIRERLANAGMELRVQLDTQGEVWGDSVLLEAALDEMLHNVVRHARGATVVQLRLRDAGADRFQLMVKDDGPGMSADRLAELFGPLATEQPERGEGLGVYLLRRVAEAHGGRSWANSLEGKGTTFYLELPAASPDGTAQRASAVAGKSPA